MPTLSYALILTLFAIFVSHIPRIHARALTANPHTIATPLIQPRQDASPTFPTDPPSCPICSQSYTNINSCAAAAPVLANVSMILFNPGAFVDVIECACTDTFQAAYPQCVDCFTRTNQTEFLSAPADSLPGILSGIRSICAIESTLLGNASVADGEVSSSVTSSAALPTDSTVLTSSAVQRHAMVYSSGLVVPMRLDAMVLIVALGTVVFSI